MVPLLHSSDPGACNAEHGSLSILAAGAQQMGQLVARGLPVHDPADHMLPAMSGIKKMAVNDVLQTTAAH